MKLGLKLMILLMTMVLIFAGCKASKEQSEDKDVMDTVEASENEAKELETTEASKDTTLSSEADKADKTKKEEPTQKVEDKEEVDKKSSDAKKNELDKSLESYLSEGLSDEATSENILDFLMGLGKKFPEENIDFVDVKLEQYFVFTLKDSDGYLTVYLWKLGDQQGFQQVAERAFEVDGVLKERYLVVDSGTDVMRLKTLIDVSQDSLQTQAVGVRGPIYDLVNTSWVVFQGGSKGSFDIEPPYDAVTDIVLYNIETGKKKIYLQAEKNYGWAIKPGVNDNTIDIWQESWNDWLVEGAVVEIKELLYETQNLKEWMGTLE